MSTTPRITLNPDTLIRRYSDFFGLTDYWFSALASIIHFASSVYANYMASAYAPTAASNAVSHQADALAALVAKFKTQTHGHSLKRVA